MDNIIVEITDSWKLQDKDYLEDFIESLINYLEFSKIICIGAGRMGYSVRAFSMRLMHLGYNSSFISDTNVSCVDKDTLVIISTSSGETPTNILYAEQVKKAGGTLCVITQNPNSSVGLLSDLVLPITCGTSCQPMKTLAEQYTYLLFDYIASRIMSMRKISEDSLQSYHSTLE